VPLRVARSINMLSKRKAVQDVPAGATAPRAASPAAAGIAEATLPVAVHGLRRVMAAAHGRSMLAAHILRPVAVARRNQPAVALAYPAGVAARRRKAAAVAHILRWVAGAVRIHPAAVEHVARRLSGSVSTGRRWCRQCVRSLRGAVAAVGGGGHCVCTVGRSSFHIGGETTLRRENVQLPNFTGKRAVIVAPRWYQATAPPVRNDPL
jgi:hypothetical protein